MGLLVWATNERRGPISYGAIYPRGGGDEQLSFAVFVPPGKIDMPFRRLLMQTLTPAEELLELLIKIIINNIIN